MELLGTKAEIKLKKAEPIHWRSLELVKVQQDAKEDSKSDDKNTGDAVPADPETETNTQRDKEKA